MLDGPTGGLTDDGTQHVVWSDASFVGSSIPTTDAATVYALGFTHEVMAATKTSGSVLWRVTLRSGGTTYGENLVLTSGTLAVGDSAVYGLDPADGHVRWTFAPTPSSAPGRFRLSTDGRTIYAGSSDGHAFAIDPATGAARWVSQVLPASDVRIVDPKIEGGIVYVGYDDYTQGPEAGGVAALDATSGAVRWTAALPPATPGAETTTLGVVVAGDVVVAGARDGRIYGLDRATGATLWTAPPVAVPASVGGSPATDVRELASAGTSVYAASRTGYVTAIDATSGRVRWTAPTRYGSALWVAADATQVYVVHGYGQMTVLDAASGAVRWVLPTNGPAVAFVPAIDGEQLYIDGSRGLYALRAH
jgi:outer membrane protein assembly factor BamB